MRIFNREREGELGLLGVLGGVAFGVKFLTFVVRTSLNKNNRVSPEELDSFSRQLKKAQEERGKRDRRNNERIMKLFGPVRNAKDKAEWAEVWEVITWLRCGVHRKEKPKLMRVLRRRLEHRENAIKNTRRRKSKFAKLAEVWAEWDRPKGKGGFQYTITGDSDVPIYAAVNHGRIRTLIKNIKRILAPSGPKRSSSKKRKR